MGTGPFDNDHAASWLGDIQPDDPTHLGGAFAAVTRDGPVSAVDATIAIAAAEILAAMNGAPADDLPEGIRSFATSAAPADPALVGAARTALDRVTGEGSELAEQWDATGEATPWRARLSGLRERLGGA